MNLNGLGRKLVRDMVDDLSYTRVSGKNRVEATIVLGQESAASAGN